MMIGLGLLLLTGIASLVIAQKVMPPNGQAANLDPTQQKLASQFLDRLDAGHYDEALTMGTPTLRQGLANGKLKQAWEALPAQLGERQLRGKPRGETIEGNAVVSSRLQFALIALDARVVFDTSNAISGFWIVPAGNTPAATISEKESAYRERELVIGKGSSSLPASLTLPHGQGPFMAVVLVHGSGAHDRDETIGPNKPFLDLAQGLAKRGIAVLRYEKRTLAHPELFAKGGFTVDEETVDDALAAVALMGTQADIDAKRIFVLGHSLGAMMSPRIGQRDDSIAGLILLAAPASKLEDIVVRQSRYLARLQGQSDAAIEKALTAIEPQIQAVKHFDASASEKATLLLGLPASYWRDLNTYDPIASARSIRQPILLLQGGRDYQVTVTDEFSKWRKAFATNPRFKMIEYPTLGHAFMPGNDPPGPKDYEVPAHVDAKVLDDIAQWMMASPAHAE